MNCPNCGTPETARVKVCPSCGEAYASQDLLELHNLEFLVKETARWKIDNTLVSPYQERLEALRIRLVLSKPADAVSAAEAAVLPTVTAQPVPLTVEPVQAGVAHAAAAEIKPAVPATIEEKAAATAPAKPKVETAPPAPPVERVPFDQWLLSERNIKIALYSGGLLLVVAGLIFIGVNWTRIPGPAKFAITVMITGLMYLGGYLLFQRPLLKLGGVALLGVASGFLAIDFAVLQIYVLGPAGLSNEVMWLIASPLCLLLYALTAYWTRGDLFVFLSMAAAASMLTAALVLVDASELAFVFWYALLALAFGSLGRGLEATSLEDFTRRPLTIVAHIAIPMAFFAALLGELFGALRGNPWLTTATLAVATIFYALNAWWRRVSLFTYLSLAAFGILLAFGMGLLETPALVFILVYALLGFALLGLAQVVRKTSAVDYTRLPFTIASHLVVPVTYLAAGLAWFSNTGCRSCPFGYPWLALVTMAVGVVFYAVNAAMTKDEALVGVALAAFAATLAAGMAMVNVDVNAFPLVYAVLALLLLALVKTLREGSPAFYLHRPFLYGAQLAIPFTYIFGMLVWLTTSQTRLYIAPWLGLLSLGAGVLFYILTDAIFGWRWTRWVAAILFPIALTPLLMQIEFTKTAIGITLMLLTLFYLGLGYWLERREQQRSAGWPLYATAYVLAGLVTILVITKTDDLIKALFGDVLLLCVSAAIHRRYEWVWGAVWLFMLPVYLTINLLVTEVVYQGLLMGVLGLNYYIAGYALGRRALRQGAPFLAAAAFLSVLVPIMAWSNSLVAALTLGLIAALYLLAALWLKWTWMLYPSLLAVHLVVLAVAQGFIKPAAVLVNSLLLCYFVLGVAAVIGGLFLRRRGADSWAWPLYISGSIDQSCAYLAAAGLAITSSISGSSPGLAVGISLVFTLLLLSFAWLEREEFIELDWPGMLTDLALGVIFVTQFLVFYIIGTGAWRIWPAIAAGLCAVYIAVSWLLRKGLSFELYGRPLHRAGLWLMIIPLVGAAVNFGQPVLVAITFAIAGVTLAVDAAVRRVLKIAYLAGGIFVVVVWAVMQAFHVTEPQAYILPAGLALLALGWSERRHEKYLTYRLASLIGLIGMTGSAFIQSLDEGGGLYAVLLLVESLVAVAWGSRNHSRGYVQVGAAAFLVNAIAQIGPAFVTLTRWIQLAIIGSLLLGGGLAALFRREQILTMRRTISQEWRQWKA